MLCLKVFAFSLLGISVTVTASSEDIMKQRYAQLIMECAKVYPITAQDIELIKQKQMPESRNVKCLFACAYKNSGMMDQQGLLSVAGVHDMTRQIFADNPASMHKTIQFTEACSAVNNEFVTDGSEGCERAALLFKCTVENAPHFDFVI